MYGHRLPATKVETIQLSLDAFDLCPIAAQLLFNCLSVKGLKTHVMISHGRVVVVDS